MECKHYLPDKIWTADQACWPGDWEGRTILGLVSLWGATKKEPSYLEEILDILHHRLNELGYMGEIPVIAEIYRTKRHSLPTLTFRATSPRAFTSSGGFIPLYTVQRGKSQ